MAATGTSSTILVIGVEFLAVGLFALIAGISDDVGNLVVIFMIGLWLILMISDSKIFTGLGNALSNVVKQTPA
jgi:hypothetical protein